MWALPSSEARGGAREWSLRAAATRVLRDIGLAHPVANAGTRVAHARGRGSGEAPVAVPAAARLGRRGGDRDRRRGGIHPLVRPTVGVVREGLAAPRDGVLGGVLERAHTLLLARRGEGRVGDLLHVAHEPGSCESDDEERRDEGHHAVPGDEPEEHVDDPADHDRRDHVRDDAAREGAAVGDAHHLDRAPVAPVEEAVERAEEEDGAEHDRRPDAEPREVEGVADEEAERPDEREAAHEQELLVVEHHGAGDVPRTDGAEREAVVEEVPHGGEVRRRTERLVLVLVGDPEQGSDEDLAARGGSRTEEEHEPRPAELREHHRHDLEREPCTDEGDERGRTSDHAHEEEDSLGARDEVGVADGDEGRADEQDREGDLGVARGAVPLEEAPPSGVIAVDRLVDLLLRGRPLGLRDREVADEVGDEREEARADEEDRAAQRDGAAHEEHADHLSEEAEDHADGREHEPELQGARHLVGPELRDGRLAVDPLEPEPVEEVEHVGTRAPAQERAREDEGRDEQGDDVLQDRLGNLTEDVEEVPRDAVERDGRRSGG